MSANLPKEPSLPRLQTNPPSSSFLARTLIPLRSPYSPSHKASRSFRHTGIQHPNGVPQNADRLRLGGGVGANPTRLHDDDVVTIQMSGGEETRCILRCALNIFAAAYMYQLDGHMAALGVDVVNATVAA
jgi:hypothetical protein